MSASFEHDEAPPGPLELLLVRLTNIPVVLLGRVLDVLLLAWRPGLLRVYFGLWLRELTHTPYVWPKRSFETALRDASRGRRRRDLLYGELPVFSALWLLRRAGLRRGGALLDIGAGRGRPLLAAALLRARARGLEVMGSHVEVAAPLLSRAGVQLEQGDALEAELGAPTHVLLNWCAFGEATRARLMDRLEGLPPGTVLIAVTVPLDERRFPLVRRHRALFTWGTERVYVHTTSAGSNTVSRSSRG